MYKATVLADTLDYARQGNDYILHHSTAVCTYVKDIFIVSMLFLVILDIFGELNVIQTLIATSDHSLLSGTTGELDYTMDFSESVV